MSTFRLGAFGWLRDLPDPRDFGSNHPLVLALSRELKPSTTSKAKKADWSEYFPPIVDQQDLNTCASCACTGLAGYFERRSNGESAPSSRLFLYQATRRLSGGAENCGTELRATLKALARFGLPPERYWPYDPSRLRDEPGPFLYAYANRYHALVYVRLDLIGMDGASVLRSVKAHLAAGFPSVFGFPAFESLTSDPDVAFPTRFDAVVGGCSVVAVGYDDARRIRSTKGALRVRASWGVDWGDGGYGWLPYAYVEEGLAVDFWTLLRPDWLASGEFLAPLG